MANDNVKIIINEVNETSPLGSGTSSDIAYIPGLAVEKWVTKVDDKGKPVEYKQIKKLDEYGNTIKRTNHDGTPLFDANGNYVYETEDWTPSHNVPVYCSTVDEFESYFGPEPYKMTKADIASGYPHTYQEGDYDKSYLYAKELLNAGMSIIYENISSYQAMEDIAVIDYIEKEDQEVNLEPTISNKFSYVVPIAPETTDGTFSFVMRLNTSVPSGSVKLLYSLPNDAMISFVKPEVVTCSNAKFTYDSATDTISWANCTDIDHKYATFAFDIDYQYEYNADTSIAGKTYELQIQAVDYDIYRTSEGSNIAPVSKISYLYDNLPESLNRLEDKNEYSVKYITSGGYPTFILVTQADGSKQYTLADAMIDCAAQRGDAVAIIDHIDDPGAALRYNDEGSFYYLANDYFKSGTNNEYGTMFTPWGRYTCVTVTDTARMSQLMPASFGYLMCMATAIKTSPNWLAMAGVTRGIVPNLKELHTNEILSNVIAEDYQPKFGKNFNNISVNAITNVKPYGLTIWGNRTLEPVHERGTTAHNFLNTRNMVSDIKKLAYSTAKSLMFEQDSDVLWLKFKSGISPLLDQLVGGFGISGYKIIRGTTKYNGQPLTRGEIAAVIKIFPLYAIEYFEITVVLADDDVTVS